MHGYLGRAFAAIAYLHPARQHFRQELTRGGPERPCEHVRSSRVGKCLHVIRRGHVQEFIELGLGLVLRVRANEHSTHDSNVDRHARSNSASPAPRDVIILFPWWLFRNFAWSGSKHDHGCGSGPQTISATCSGCGSSHKRQKNTRLRSGSGRLTRGTALLFGHDGRARWPHSRPNCAKHALRGGCYPYLAYQKSKLGTAGLRAVPPHVKIPWKILAGPCSLGTYFLQARVELAVLASAVGLPGEPGRTLAGQG